MEKILLAVGQAGLVTFALGLNVFTVLYAARKPWRFEGIGKFLFAVFIMFTLVFDLILVFQFVPLGKWAELILAAIIWPTCAVVIWKLILVVLAARQREKARG